MTTQNKTKKPTIQRTNRILMGNHTIYCSCDIVREVRDHLIRVNQKLAPKKGEKEVLRGRLRELAASPKWANHFPNSARIVLLE